MVAPYHTVHATMNSDMTQTQVGMRERASARRGSNGSSALKASTLNRISPRLTALGRNPDSTMPGPL